MMSSGTRRAEEEVFETPDFAEDGLEQTAVGSDSVRSKALNKVPDAEVVASFVPPQAAFEVFMGRTYAGVREDMSDVVGANSAAGVFDGGAVYEGDGFHHQSRGEGASGEGGYSSSGGIVGGDGAPSGVGTSGGALRTRRRRTGESPLQRLVRLREETAMLAEDLEEMSKARRNCEDSQGGEGEGEAGGDDSAANRSAGGYQLWSAMAKETEALKRQLALLSGDPKFKHILTSAAANGQDQEALQQRLSEGLVKALEGLRGDTRGGAGGTATDAATTATTATTATSLGGGDTSSGSVTYELFLSEAAEARRRFGAGSGAGMAAESIPGAEARIAALEEALGGGAGMAEAGLVGKGGETIPLVDLVASLEKRVSILEPGRLDGLRQKAQLAKAELDTLAKSMSSGALGSSSSPSSAAAAASRNRKVDEAFATLETWQGIAAGLPALVDRLRALETLHLASASFAQRLEQVETGQMELEGVLKSTGESLDATVRSSVENVTIVNENVKALDNRLAGLGLAV